MADGRQLSEWTHVNNPKERKRIQNRIAQRTYRDKRKLRMEKLEALFDSQFTPPSTISCTEIQTSPTYTVSPSAGSNRSQATVPQSIQTTGHNQAASSVASSHLVLTDDGHGGSNGSLIPTPMSEDADFLLNDYEDWSEFAGSKGTIGMSRSVGSSNDAYGEADLRPISGIASLSPPSSHGMQGNFSGKTGLHLAAENGRAACVRLLLERNMDAAICDDDGYTALHLGIARGHLEVVREICTSIIQNSSLRRETEPRAEQNQSITNPATILNMVDRAGNTPLHTAISTNQQRILSLLLHLGKGYLDLEIQNSQGLTALHMAAAIGHADIVKMLLDNAADAAARVGRTKR